MVLLELSVVPLGAGESVSHDVAACVELIEQSGLDYELHAMGTIVEGELGPVIGVMQACVELLAERHPRVTCSAKLDYRRGASGRLRGKVESVEAKLRTPKKG
ncbi:MAG: MTH1187 family thiamine-binding protein [Planctomycetota bacterium]